MDEETKKDKSTQNTCIIKLEMIQSIFMRPISVVNNKTSNEIKNRLFLDDLVDDEDDLKSKTKLISGFFYTDTSTIEKSKKI